MQTEPQQKRWTRSTPALWAVIFAAVALTHLTLLQLPYYWDEGGYYIPAALDFYHRWTLIPQFTNAHPPLPSIILGLLWHVLGYHILVTRLTAAAFAAMALVAVFRLGEELVGESAAPAITLLTAVYPIWFAQSTLAHADIFAAAFTLIGLAVYFNKKNEALDSFGPALVGLLFTLAALSKETAVIEPVTLAAIELVLIVRQRSARGESLRWLFGLAFPVLPLAAWFAYHRWKTGFIFGNPEFLRYNATGNFTVEHVWMALRYRFMHLFWQRDIWLPLLLAAACLFLPKLNKNRLHARELKVLAILVLSNWLFFSILGGALLTRYLLPMYPLILLACVAVWRERSTYWLGLAALVAAAFVSAWWINPPVSFAPEDNLTYRDMIEVHRDASDYVVTHYPHATVLTAWPMAADLTRPELGYVRQRIQVTSVENFSAEQILKAGQDPESFDTAIVFTTHYMSPALARYLAKHPNSARGKEFATGRDLDPQEVATMLHGRVVWQENHNGEWAAVLRFDRQYEAVIRYRALR